METPFHLPLPEAILTVCRNIPDHVAACANEKALRGRSGLTYRELDAESRRLAEELKKLSVRSYEPIVVFISNAPEDLVSLLAIWLVGAVAVPLYFDTGQETVRTVLDRTDARLILLKEGVAAESVIPAGEERNLSNIRLRIIGSGALAGQDILHDGALVMFTSGSTGKPKGVVLSRSSFMRKLQAIQNVLRFPEGLRTLLVLKLSFAFGQWVSMLTLLRGGTIVMCPKFSAMAFLELLQEDTIDQVAVVPTMLRALLNDVHRGESADRIAKLCAMGRPRLICTGGEPIAPAIVSQLRTLLAHTGIADVFGLTETCTSDFILSPEQFDRYIGSIGFPSPGVEFRIRNRETGEIASMGEIGELEIRSEYIMRGYLGEPELTGASFRDGYFLTGDLARQGDDGQVYLAGRCKDLIMRGGYKISPLEVDALLLQHPQVAACLTTGLPDDLLGERIHTLVVLREQSGVDAEELRSWLKSRLDRYKVPDQIHIGTNIPQGGTGKDDRRELQRFLSRNASCLRN
jgi:long-chain acyl-CoA synthetase